MLKFIKSTNQKNVIILIHGILSSNEIWVDIKGPKSFVNYLIEDKMINDNYDIATFSYVTTKFESFNKLNWFCSLIKKNRKPKVNLNIVEISELLKTEINVKLRDYKKVAIVAHSMGGLITKAYLVNNLNNPVELYVSLAVPHKGSHLSNLFAKFLKNPQMANLKPINNLLDEINSKWVKKGTSKLLPKTIYHQGKYDRIVTKESAIGFDSRDATVIYSEHSHSTIHSPKSKNDTVIISVIQDLKDMLEQPTKKKEKKNKKWGDISIKNSDINNSFNS